MNQATQNKTAKPATSGSVNPFARALAETEHTSDFLPNSSNSLDAFRAALEKAQKGDHSSQATADFGDMQSEDYFQTKRQEYLKQQQIEMLRKKRHDQVNPAETHALFDARRKQEAEQIEQLRISISNFAQPVIQSDSQVYNTLNSEITEDPGIQANYFKVFLDGLAARAKKALKIFESKRNGAVWAETASGKRKKGMQIAGQNYQKTNTVQNMMHHERSSSYAGA